MVLPAAKKNAGRFFLVDSPDKYTEKHKAKQGKEVFPCFALLRVILRERCALEDQ